MKKYLVSFALVVFFTMLFSACVMDVDTKDSDIKYYARNWPLTSLAREQNFGYFILKSDEQKNEYIDQVRAETGSQIIWEKYEGPDLTSSLNKYNDAFFTHSNLVMFSMGISGGNEKNCTVKKMGVKNNELYIRIERKHYIGPTPASVMSVCILIPVKKSSFNGDTVNIEIRDIYTFW